MFRVNFAEKFGKKSPTEPSQTQTDTHTAAPVRAPSAMSVPGVHGYMGASRAQIEERVRQKREEQARTEKWKADMAAFKLTQQRSQPASQPAVLTVGQPASATASGPSEHVSDFGWRRETRGAVEVKEEPRAAMDMVTNDRSDPSDPDEVDIFKHAISTVVVKR